MATVTVGVDEDDAAVIEGSWREPQRFAVLFDRHYAEIHRYARRRLGPDHADDVAAEVFLIAFDRRGRYDLHRVDARPWLYGIGSNLISARQRAEMRQYRLLARSGPAAQSGHADHVAARVDAQAVRGRLAAALAGIAERDRAVLLLVAWADLSCEQAARALGIRPGTARSRLHRARKKIRAALGGADPTLLGKDQD